ncbi:DNA-binding protein [Rufibacter radiotolerans]|uniref:DNA-binding protein n=1 Tax=Rufibacter radiotolerans TaxID=1379910 RepID=A0A0H4VFP5_9BACT|nr:helix-turn-helix domain-containing protein [Rufibacter radiotolerans]AKQ44440.1 DNA-binding protein [Rufibacter radiotolerans]
MELQNLEARLKNIESLLLTQKTVLNFDEAAAYTGLSKSYLYKLTSAAGIPHFKPQGKHIYFNKLEVDQWLQRNPCKPLDKALIEEQADTYISLNKMGGARC